MTTPALRSSLPFLAASVALTVACAAVLAPTSLPYRQRGVAVAPDGGGGLILDAYGRAYPSVIGTGAAPGPPAGLTPWGHKVGRGLAVVPATGSGVRLDGCGGLVWFAMAITGH